MLKLNGKVLPYDTEFTVDGVIYPSNWLRRSTLVEKQAIGIEETAPPAWYDQRFYTGVDQPKDHAKLVIQFVAQVNKSAANLLAETDWEIIRAADPSSSKTIDPAVTALRTAIRTKSDEKEAAIKATTTTAELEAYITSSAYIAWV